MDTLTQAKGITLTERQALRILVQHGFGEAEFVEAQAALQQSNAVSVSAYGAGAPTYADAYLQRHAIQGRAELARRWAVRYAESGDEQRATKWNLIADELLDRLLEVRGR